jgi:peptide deformylase
MILPIYTYGQPILRKEAEIIDKDYPGLKKLINDMFETMYNAEGVGLAAPQIGLSIRLLVIDADPVSDSCPECKEFKRILINPEITEFSNETSSIEEGCLSFPGLQEKVSRSTKIRVRYKDADFNEQEETIEGFSARIVQHECEHLNGGMFIDDISPIRRQLNKSKLNNIVKGNISCNYKIKPHG